MFLWHKTQEKAYEFVYAVFLKNDSSLGRFVAFLWFFKVLL